MVSSSIGNNQRASTKKVKELVIRELNGMAWSCSSSGREKGNIQIVLVERV